MRTGHALMPSINRHRLPMTWSWCAAALAVALAVPTNSTAKVIGQMTNPAPLTDARIATLPVAQRGAWTAYLARSRALLAADKAALAAERRGRPAPPPPPSGPSGGAGMPLDRPAAWYGGAEARHAADTIVSFQTPAGGWGKNVDRSGPARLPGQLYVPVEHLAANARSDIPGDEDWAYVGTIDNNATTTELRFLARVQAQAPGAEGERYRASFTKGIGYLLAAQFPCGGWPQVYPLQGGYHDALTYNDDAISDVVTLLENTAVRSGDYASVAPDLAARARAAVDRAYAVILATQVRVGGTLTVWGQQYDPLTLAPVGARNFEPASLSAAESSDLLLLLMRQPHPSPQTKAAIGAGVAWLRDHAIAERAWTRGANGRELVVQTGAKPIWSRFYDIATQRPIFGDRDKTIHDDVSDLSRERRDGYSWYNNGPLKALNRYAVWQVEQGQ